MSHEAIAAALARCDLSIGERLVAFSLASFADRDGRARPGTPAAAARAALKKSWFLEARDQLERHGLVVVETAATGRGRASTLWLAFADAGPWWEGEINAVLFETALSYSRARGSARLLLGAMAALADAHRVCEGVTTAELCAAAGFSDRTYRRAQAALLASGELRVGRGMGGRGNTNCWEILDPRSGAGEVEPVPRQRVTPRAGQRPLLADVAWTTATADTLGAGTGGAEPSVALPVAGEESGRVSRQKRPVTAGVSGRKGGAGRTLSAVNRPVSAGVFGRKGGAGRTVSPETPAQTPAETPAPNARGGREPQNPRTVNPPNPPEGGSRTDQAVVEETYRTGRGRWRRRSVTVDLAVVRKRLRPAGAADHIAWEQVRSFLRDAVSESVFEIWLAPLALIAVDPEGTLIVSAPQTIVGWVRVRASRLLEDAARRTERTLRLADESERQAARALSAATSPESPHDVGSSQSPDRPANPLAYRSAYPSSYTDVYDHQEVGMS